MRTLKLTIAYDGTRYAGWQVQNPGAGGTGRARHDARHRRAGWAREQQTIQGTLERVLSRILQESVKVVGSGRTDAGVHALGQVAHVRTQSLLPRERLLRSLNALVPPDIAVMRVEEAPPTFHARFDARSKRYRYRIFTGPIVPPFIRPYVHHVRTPLDIPLMRREARGLRGRHDFRAFARAGGGGRGTVRTITDIRLLRHGDELHVEVEGTGFLHTMVRSIVGTLVDVGRGRLPPGTIGRMVRTKRRGLSGTTAPACALLLMSVGYRKAVRRCAG